MVPHGSLTVRARFIPAEDVSMSFGKYFVRLCRRLVRRHGHSEPAPRAHRLGVEQLEDRLVPSASKYLLDFGTASSPVASGYTRVAAQAYDPAKGFGWQSTTGISGFDKGGSNLLTRDVNRGTGTATFLADVDPGTYHVTATVGDPSVARDQLALIAEGQRVASGISTARNQFQNVSFDIDVTDGQLTLQFLDEGGVSSGFSIAALQIGRTTDATIWADSVTPTNTSASDSSAVELGVKFQADRDGYITGVRFYKGSGNTGTHVGNLWAADGTLLATATFTNETATGWQQVNFSSPVAIKANTTYIASYFAPGGHYAYDYYYFATSVTNGPLKALADGENGPNSVFRYGSSSGFPSSTYRSTNYWVDVVFSDSSTSQSPAPTANAGVDQSADEGSSVSFKGSATGTGLSYAWDFGDGSTTTGTLTPSHTYADNGKYTATLTVTDSSGQTASDTATITVNNVAPTASFTNNGAVTAGNSVTVSFSNQSDPSSVDTNAGFTYSYDFNNDGTFDVANSTSASASTTFTTAGTYTVTGRIADKDGGFTDYTTTVTVNDPAPTADAGVDQSADEGSSVSFKGSATGTGLSYAWDFGDGSTTTGTLTPSHTYADNGKYTATLTVTDSSGQTASDTATITVNNVAPTASFTNNGAVTAGNSVTVSFSNQSDPSSVDTNAGFTYSYDFNNDGTFDVANSTSASASTTFTTAGTYTVTGRIADKDGGFTDYTTTVTVNDPAPTADAGVDQSADEGSSVSFKGSATGTGLSYAWDFGDGSTTTGTLTPSHTYADNGKYTATLTVTDSSGQTASDT